MPRKLREIRADLRRMGFETDHQTGSHQVWKPPSLPGMGAVIVVSDAADAKPHQERQLRNMLKAVRDVKESGES